MCGCNCRKPRLSFPDCFPASPFGKRYGSNPTTKSMKMHLNSNPIVVEAYPLPCGHQIEHAPSAPPMMSGGAPSAASATTINEAAAREYLSGHKWPSGLQDALLKSLVKIPVRFFICDDSGSMLENDGHKLISNTSLTKLVQCTRWQELAASLAFHSELAYNANAWSEFRLLNGAAPIVIGDAQQHAHSNSSNLSTFHGLLTQSPSGGTPLCKHIREVIDKIRSMEHHLRASGQKACLVIMTDGMSSDGDLAQAMRPLKHLPVWTVVRLCTDSISVVKYWNNIDCELEMDMDVLDDLAGEAKEVNTHNPWLTYGEPLHRLREFGTPVKEIDLLDESNLSLEQIRLFCSLLFGVHADKLPHPCLNRLEFIEACEHKLKALPKVWDPLQQALKPWINVRYLPGGQTCACTVC